MCKWSKDPGSFLLEYSFYKYVCDKKKEDILQDLAHWPCKSDKKIQLMMRRMGTIKLGSWYTFHQLSTSLSHPTLPDDQDIYHPLLLWSLKTTSQVDKIHWTKAWVYWMVSLCSRDEQILTFVNGVLAECSTSLFAAAAASWLHCIFSISLTHAVATECPCAFVTKTSDSCLFITAFLLHFLRFTFTICTTGNWICRVHIESAVWMVSGALGS